MPAYCIVLRSRTQDIVAKKTNGRAICQEAVAWRAGAPEMAFGALGGGDWWDKHRLGYGVVATVASLQHWASRLKMVASMAKVPAG